MKRFNQIWFLFLILCSNSVLATTGHLAIMVYRDGLPQRKQAVQVGEEILSTDSNGMVYFDLLPSGKHEVRLVIEGKEHLQSIQIEANSETQMIINLFPDAETLNIETFEPEKSEYEVNVKEESLGTLNGQVLAVGTTKPVAGAKVFVKGSSRVAQTDGMGRFQLKLPEGSHVLSVSHQQFAMEMVRDVIIEKGAVQTKTVAMVPTTLQMEEFVVLAPRGKGSIEGLIEVRQKSSNVADVLSSEQISKSGDGHAASSLRRVTGLTLVDGKYVYVRGLGERYSNTLLDGVVLSSPDPSRRVVPLDLFPVNVLESMVIQKSYSPDRSGEFGGGSIMLTTKSFPEEFFFKASLGKSFSSLYNGRPQGYQGGRTDKWGFDDGTRALPKGLSLDLPGTGKALQAFKNIHNVNTVEDDTLPSFNFSFGDTFKFGKTKESYLFSLLYSDDWNQAKENQNQYLSSGVLQSNSEKNKNIRTVRLGGLGGLGFSLGKTHKLNTNYLWVRHSSDQTEQASGSTSEKLLVRDTTLEWTERELRALNIHGSHYLPFVSSFKLDWHHAQSKASRYEPDRRNYRYAMENGQYIFYGFKEQEGTNYQRRFSLLEENTADFGAQLTKLFRLWGPYKNELTLGFNQVDKARKSRVRRYGLNKGAGDLIGFSGKGDPLEEIFDKCVNCFVFKDDAGPSDNYSASQSIESYYLNSKLYLLTNIELNMGVRQEHSIQTVQSYALFRPDLEPTISRLKTWDTLPAVGVIWRLPRDMQVRVAYSETVSRPDFKELSNTRWRDDEKNYEVEGNPDLNSATIQNIDLRWEWYFRRKENISIGFFQKEFAHPIENILKGSPDTVLTFENAGSATNSGVELEFRKNLGFFGRNLAPASFSGNLSYIHSEIKLDNLKQLALTSKQRPLQGQSPYVLNFMVDYELEKIKANFSLVYNIFGPRISEVGTDQFPDIYEQSFEQLDFVAQKKISDIYSISFKATNLLNSKAIYKQGENITKEVVKGQAYGLSLSASL